MLGAFVLKLTSKPLETLPERGIYILAVSCPNRRVKQETGCGPDTPDKAGMTRVKQRRGSNSQPSEPPIL